MRYLVSDQAIGPEGRVVRCASCKHSWFQPPAMMETRAPGAMRIAPEHARSEGTAAPRPTPSPAPPAPPARPADTEPAYAQAYARSLPEQPMHDAAGDAVGDAPAPRIHRSAPIPRTAPSSVSDAAPGEGDQTVHHFVDPDAEKGMPLHTFAQRPAFRPRRNPARRWTAAAVVAGVSMLVAAGALLYTGASGDGSSIGFPMTAGDTPLRLNVDQRERRVLPSGNELFAVSGRIVNPTGERQRVPDIRAELKDSGDRIVYSWTITPPLRELGPSGSATFNSAKLDVPANSKTLVLSFSNGF